MLKKEIDFFENKEIYLLTFLVLFSFFIRIPVVYVLGDTSLEHEWIVLVNNLINHGKLAFSYHDAHLSKYLFPNLYMPPLYAYYLYLFLIINFQDQVNIQIVLFSQILLASISVIIFYKLNKIFFSKRLSFYSSVFFSAFPLHLYACSQISSITLQTFLTISFFYLFFRFIKEKNFSLVFLISLTSGLLILLRQEFVAVLILSLAYAYTFYKINIKKIFFIFLISLITISPYLIRNFIIFDTITITKTTGYNLWKGSHPMAEGIEGSEIKDNNLRKKIDSIPKNKFYGLNYDNLFLNEAIKNIKDDPLRYLGLFFKKAISFLLIDLNSTAPNYYHPLHYLPVLLLGITTLFGIGFSDKKSYKLNYLILIFFFYVFIFSTVSILPRYKLIILPLQIIFTNVLIDKVKKFIS